MNCKEAALPSFSQGLVHGVPFDLQDDEILEFTNATKMKRLSRFEDGKKTETTSVVLWFEDDLPDAIKIGFIRY